MCGCVSVCMCVSVYVCVSVCVCACVGVGVGYVCTSHLCTDNECVRGRGSLMANKKETMM